MAASAEYELEKRVERLELFPVELEKGERPRARPQSVGESPLWRQLHPGPLRPLPPATGTPAARAPPTAPRRPTLCPFRCPVPRAPWAGSRALLGPGGDRAVTNAR